MKASSHLKLTGTIVLLGTLVSSITWCSLSKLDAQDRDYRALLDVAFSIAPILIMGFAAYFSLRRISRPILQLTQTLVRLSRRDYTGTIRYIERTDEIGHIARALQVLKENMLRADQLELEAAAHAEALSVIKAQAEQAASNNALLLTTMSQRTRAPLNTIIDLAQQCLEQQTPQQQDTIEKILHCAEHLLAIINDTLDLSKTRNSHVQPESIAWAPQEPLTDTCITLNLAPLTQLQQLIRPERFADMLSLLLRDCQQRALMLRKLADEPDSQTLEQQTNALISITGQVGLNRLHALAEDLWRQLPITGDAHARNLVLAICAEIQLALEALRQHFEITD